MQDVLSGETLQTLIVMFAVFCGQRSALQYPTMERVITIPYCTSMPLCHSHGVARRVPCAVLGLLVLHPCPYCPNHHQGDASQKSTISVVHHESHHLVEKTAQCKNRLLTVLLARPR